MIVATNKIIKSRKAAAITMTFLSLVKTNMKKNIGYKIIVKKLLNKSSFPKNFKFENIL